jgi:hypothetical protein
LPSARSTPLCDATRHDRAAAHSRRAHLRDGRSGRVAHATRRGRARRPCSRASTRPRRGRRGAADAGHATPEHPPGSRHLERPAGESTGPLLAPSRADAGREHIDKPPEASVARRRREILKRDPCAELRLHGARFAWESGSVWTCSVARACRAKQQFPSGDARLLPCMQSASECRTLSDLVLLVQSSSQGPRPGLAPLHAEAAVTQRGHHEPG